MAHFSSHSMLPLQFCYRLYACLLLLAFFGAFSIFAVALMSLYGVGGVELVFTICFVAFHALLRLFIPSPWNPAGRVVVGPSQSYYSSFYGGSGMKIDHDDHPKTFAIDKYQYKEEGDDGGDDEVQNVVEEEDKSHKESEESPKEGNETTIAVLPKNTSKGECHHLDKDTDAEKEDGDKCTKLSFTHDDDKSFIDDDDNTLRTYCRPVTRTDTNSKAGPSQKMEIRSGSDLMMKPFPVDKKKEKSDKKKTPCCPICLHTFEIGDDISKGRVCGHFFHSNCLEPWLAKKANCPYCRQNLEEKIPSGKGNVQKSGAWGIFDGIFDSMYA